MILNETVAAIADAIREKTGKSDLIAPMNFAEEIKGIAVGDSVASLMTEITWQELKDLRDNGMLVAGMKYRMIDYDTYTSQEDTQSAMHPFDLILTALDNHTLSEECSAIHSARDVDGYFANSNLGAWKVWYCLDNDINRFSWAAEKGISITGDDNATITCSKLGHSNIVVYDENQNEISGVELYTAMPYSEEQGLLMYICVDSNVAVGKNPMYVVYYNTNDYPFELEGMSVPPQSGIAVIMNIIDVTSVSKSDIVGKGVIYRLIDGEMNNDIYYDFKNIMFKSPCVENGVYYFFTMGSRANEDYSHLMGNIKITREPVIISSIGLLVVNTLQLGYYLLDPRYFDGAGMGNITIVNCPKICLYTREGYMENLYFENCSIDYRYGTSNVYSGNIQNSSFKNVNGTFVFTNSAYKYNNLDVDRVMPTEGIYDGSIKTYIRVKADGTPFAFTADDIYNAITAAKTE